MTLRGAAGLHRVWIAAPPAAAFAGAMQPGQAIDDVSAYPFSMPAEVIRVLLIADTHLGFDLPQRPRTERPRRGDDFFASYERALQPAFRGEVDLVVHGGDVFFRSQVKPGLVMRAFEPLKRLADSGVPVLVVPGNHERSAIPFPILAMHPGVHIFDRPRTFALRVGGVDVAIAGFPCERDRVRDRFAAAVEQSGWRAVPAALRLLCLHQTVEGATVGPADYMFRSAPDVIRGRALPTGFAAVLAGHIHRHQVLTADLSGRPLATPVFYPGSTERTSHAEDGEAKGSLILELEPDDNGGSVRRWSFVELSPPSMGGEPAWDSVYRSITPAPDIPGVGERSGRWSGAQRKISSRTRTHGSLTPGDRAGA